MSYLYDSRKRTDGKGAETELSQSGPSVDALRTGSAVPTQEQMGHRVDLPDAMREKMENAFGADLSAVKLYESEAVEDAGANAVTQGSNIAFAPGMLDFSSYGGQALLGHEISHVVSQARGEVTGSGFLNDHALEARADREGALAASGQTVAVPTGAMSPVSAAAAAGPMQADKNADREAKYQAAQRSVVDNVVGYQREMRGNADPRRLAAYKSALKKASRSERFRKRFLSSKSTVDTNTGSMIFNELSHDPGITDPDQLLHETDDAMNLWGGKMDDPMMASVGDLAQTQTDFHTRRSLSNDAYLSSNTNTYMRALFDYGTHASTTPQNTRFSDPHGNPMTATQFMDDYMKRQKENDESKKQLAFIRAFGKKHGFSNDNV